MNIRSLAKNAAVAFLAQGVGFLVSFLTTLFVPKVLGVTEYGYWQLFVFYSSYVGFFLFGLNDGIYLLRGGQVRAEIDKQDINSQFLFGGVSQGVIALAIMAIAFWAVEDADRSFVLFLTAIFFAF